MMKHLIKHVFLPLAICLAAVACDKVNLDNVPLSEGEIVNNEPVTKAQWDALKIEEGQWILKYYYKKEWGEWKKDERISIRYAFTLPDQVHWTKDFKGPGDAGDRGIDKWSFDSETSTLTISEIEYKMIDVSADSFSLVFHSALNSPSTKLYNFVRIR